MFFKIGHETQTFLILANKQATGAASPEEIRQLRSLVADNESLSKELFEIQSEARTELRDSTMETYLRVALGTASAIEIEKVNNDPESRVAFDRIKYFLEQLAKPWPPQTSEPSPPEEVLKRIRNVVFTNLARPHSQGGES